MKPCLFLGATGLGPVTLSASPEETSRRTSRPVHRMRIVAIPRLVEGVRRAQSARRRKKGDPAMKRTASATWLGDLKAGKGSLTTASGVLKDTQYSFTTRFENGAGTNPEELIAAAHAGCFTMALSAFLGKAGFTPDKLTTQAAMTLEQVSGNWTVTTIHLDLSAKVPGITAEKFQEIAADAKANCPISRLLNDSITL